MGNTVIPEFKLSNVIININIFSALIGKKYFVELDNETSIYEALNDIIDDINVDPLILNYFNYDDTERTIVEDLIVNGLDYPGVKEDFLEELSRKNILSIYDKKQSIPLMVEELFGYSPRKTTEYINECIGVAKSDYSELIKIHK